MSPIFMILIIVTLPSTTTTDHYVDHNNGNVHRLMYEAPKRNQSYDSVVEKIVQRHYFRNMGEIIGSTANAKITFEWK